MKDGTPSTLPIELWQLILLEAAASPLLPFEDLNRKTLRIGVIDCLDLFDQSCDSHKDYRRHQSMLTNLRLVCHAWAMILDDYRNLCSFTDLRRVFLPIKSINVLSRTERVHVRYPEDIYCRACDACRYRQTKRGGVKSMTQNAVVNLSAVSQRLALSKEDRRWHKNPVLKTMLNPHVKIMILDSYDSSINDALTGAKELIGLAIKDASQFPWRSQLSGPILPHLTHLSINLVTYQALNLFPPVVILNNLRYLSLNCALWQDPGDNFSFPNWSLPNLKSLIVLGSVNEASGEHVCAFLQKYGMSVTELVMAGTILTRIGEYYMPKAAETI
ncbi:hypothetical protein CPB86DRAFT_521099 [Serendipita vermifera]|nr:hypothetical protein CPB86DRAFT_521099 [Serendipita vermifera]